MSKDEHVGKGHPIKENPPQKSPPSPHLKDEPHHAPEPSATRAAPNRDPDVVQPVVRPTETLPVEPKRHGDGVSDKDEPVQPARHAETREELEKIETYEHAKIPPAGSRNYVAGQPVSEEEYEQTEQEANRLAEAGRAQRTEAERRMKESTPGDPDYHPADPDKRDTPQAQSPPSKK